MSGPHDQAGYGVRLEWGLAGASRLASGVDLSVVVDVLSFSTAVSVAVGRGATVFPLPWGEESAMSRAEELGAVLAAGRRSAEPGQVSLSPASMRVGEVPARLVLPSPNGSAICHSLAESGAEVLVGCLRNRTAVAQRAAGVGSVLLVAAGERWPDGSLRPSVEDLWGAGAVAAALEDLGRDDLSEEARAAAAAYRCAEHRLLDALLHCSSGRELVESGFGVDVEIAAELDASTLVPCRGADDGFTAG